MIKRCKSTLTPSRLRSRTSWRKRIRKTPAAPTLKKKVRSKRKEARKQNAKRKASGKCLENNSKSKRQRFSKNLTNPNNLVKRMSKFQAPQEIPKSFTPMCNVMGVMSTLLLVQDSSAPSARTSTTALNVKIPKIILTLSSRSLIHPRHHLLLSLLQMMINHKTEDGEETIVDNNKEITVGHKVIHGVITVVQEQEVLKVVMDHGVAKEVKDRIRGMVDLGGNLLSNSAIKSNSRRTESSIRKHSNRTCRQKCKASLMACRVWDKKETINVVHKLKKVHGKDSLNISPVKKDSGKMENLTINNSKTS